MKTINVQAIFDGWDQLTRKHSALGAGDSEPDWHFQNSIRNLLQGKNDLEVPGDADQWELYSLPGRDAAARSLTSYLQRVLKQISRTPILELADLTAEFRKHLYRVDL